MSKDEFADTEDPEVSRVLYWGPVTWGVPGAGGPDCGYQGVDCLPASSLCAAKHCR